MWCRGHFYPGTGAVHEVGKGAGEGFTVNIPWPMGGMGNGDYMAAFSHVIIPIAHEYSPDLIIISAGFDASAGDPIGGCAFLPAVILLYALEYLEPNRVTKMLPFRPRLTLTISM